MKIDITFIKKRWTDVRLGGTQVSPLIQMANFTMITFMWINHIIPIEIFAPVFALLGLLSLSYIGVRFRAHQASTDYNLVFDRQTRQAKILYEIMRAIKEGKTDENYDKQMSYLKSISSEFKD
uniref:ORF40 n=1 Tax=Nitrosopumilaceae spindle-shaped virus TaxID=3065433 RepID=A0AAT9JF58_9VIRU